MKKNFRTGILLLALGLAYSGAMAQSPEERAWIVKHYDLEKAKLMADKFDAQFKKDKEEAMALAVQNGWPITITEKDGTYKELKKVIDGKPVYYKTFNTGAAETIKVNRINSGGGAGLNLDGQGMIVGEWDGGAVRRFHVDLTAARVIQKDGATSIDNHATHVAGTMISSGINDSAAKGMASQATLWANDWNNDLTEMVNQATQGLLVSNHSYGINANAIPAYFFGGYVTESAAWDDITFNLPYYQPVVAAGNDRNPPPLPASYPSGKGGRELIFEQATSKNVVVVAAVSGPSPIAMSSFSNWGPTDDKRVKPDISSKGVSVYSTWGTGNTAYNAINGTSMAAPGIAGGLTLLQQHYKNTHGGVFMRSATLRGIMDHTAAEVGNLGPDHQFGWGVMDAEAGAAVITNDGTASLIVESTLVQGGTYTRQIKADGINPLKVTLSWTDPAGNPNPGINDQSTPVLMNDLDVRLTKISNSTVYMPWRLNSFIPTGAPQRDDNLVDNIEKIEVLNAAGNAIEIPATGDLYTITVTHKGNLMGGSQAFSLIVSGISDVAGVDEKLLDAGISIYPNPTNDFMNISFANVAANNLDVAIYDIQGRLMVSKNITTADTAALDVSQLASGTYIVKLSGDNINFTKKIVKK